MCQAVGMDSIASAGMAAVARAMASPPRLKLLELLSQCSRTVDALAATSGLSVANASQHLQVLKRAGLVVSRRERTFVHYRLASDGIAQFLVSLRSIAEASVAELRSAATSDLEQLDRGELVERARRGEVVLLDVRPAEEYRHAHLPDARSIPLSELESRLNELETLDCEVFAYCRGPYCTLAPQAASWLRKRGVQVTVLPDGVVEWRLRGLPLEHGLSEHGS